MGSNEIWVLSETRDGELTRTAGQLQGAAKKLADQNDLAVMTLPIEGMPVDPLGELIETRGRPKAILATANSTGLELMPRLAARLKAGYASQCVDLWWEGDQLAARRPVYGGRVYEEIELLSAPALVTVRPGAFPSPDPLLRLDELQTIAVPDAGSGPMEETGRHSTTSGRQPLSEAVRVVAGGRGLGSADNFNLLEELAAALDAAVGASRAVVDAGWRPHDEQVGKSGRTISPELYIACGISGAIHHVLGMNTAKVVVAVNSDPQALIFQNADYGLVGDALQVLPALTARLKERLGK
jgi:electron transfer flavoprotein alpha subunit